MHSRAAEGSALLLHLVGVVGVFELTSIHCARRRRRLPGRAWLAPAL
jgi:hypothetical protein